MDGGSPPPRISSLNIPFQESGDGGVADLDTVYCGDPVPGAQQSPPRPSRHGDQEDQDVRLVHGEYRLYHKEPVPFMEHFAVLCTLSESEHYKGITVYISAVIIYIVSSIIKLQFYLIVLLFWVQVSIILTI